VRLQGTQREATLSVDMWDMTALTLHRDFHGVNKVNVMAVLVLEPKGLDESCRLQDC
jgi:hypothetical protein